MLVKLLCKMLSIHDFTYYLLDKDNQLVFFYIIESIPLTTGT
jgi:hypothetical protein